MSENFTHAVKQAVQHQPLRDFLQGTANMNLANKNVCSAQNSLIDPAVSTAGEYAVGGVIYTNAASSSAFALEDTSIPAYGAAAFVLCFNAAGSGIGYATNVLTSAQVSQVGAGCANVLAAMNSTLDTYGPLLKTPVIPTTMCPVGIYTVVAGAVSHVSGSSSFSLVTSAGGSHLFTNIATLNRIG